MPAGRRLRPPETMPFENPSLSGQTAGAATRIRRSEARPGRPSRVRLPRAAPGNGTTPGADVRRGRRSEEHTSELQSLMRISYAVFCLKKKKHITHNRT